MEKNESLSKVDLTFLLTLLIGLSYFIAYIYFFSEFVYYGIPLEFLDIGVKEVVFTLVLIITPITSIITGLILQYKDKDKDKDVNFKILFPPIIFFIKTRINIKKELKKYDNLIVEQEAKLLENKSDLLTFDTSETEKKVNEYKNEYLFLIIQKKAANKIFRVRMSSSIKLMFFILIVMFAVTSLIMSKYYFSSFFGSIILFSLIIYVGILILFNKSIKLIIFIISVLILYTFSLPYIHSFKENNYITFEKDEEDYIVLTTYKDNFIYVPINKDTNGIERKFNLIPINQVKTFSKESIKIIKEDDY